MQTKKPTIQKTKFLIWALALLFSGNLAAQVPNISILQKRAPETFRARFTTTKGDFVIEAYRKWSPLGVDRLYQLITSGYYANNLVYRVERNFVVQFGVADAEDLNRFWDAKKLKDEPLRHSNLKGVISYARGGPNTRTTQLFINMVNNPKNDTALRAGVRGFTPVARVISGMENIVRFFDKYGRSTVRHQDSIYKYGNRFFEKNYPGLDKILSARIVK